MPVTLRFPLVPFVLSIVVLAAACSRSEEAAPDPAAVARANAAVEEWRAKHGVDYTRDYATIAGLHLLKPGPNSAGSGKANDVVLPGSTPETVGTFTLDGDQVRFTPAPGAKVMLRDAPVTDTIVLKDDTTKEADHLYLGEVSLVVHPSGKARGIRVRDPNGPLARDFRGFSWFPIDPQYRVTGRMIRDPEPRRFKVVNTYGDADEYTSEGVVEFRLRGETLRLRPFTTRPGRLYFVFRDASSGEETYETARFLYSDLAEDGTTVLDFNMAYNPPCAFNPYTTCPIPLKENRLPVKILAGEKAYPVKVELPAPGTS